MKTGTTVPYATRRINEHILQFNKLYDDCSNAGQRSNERWLADVEAGTNLSRTSTTAYTLAELDPRRRTHSARRAASPLKVLFVASECAPFAKTGGLADVAGALPKALRRWASTCAS